ncbi:hypothetical protein ACFYXC_41800 [Streptomyces sp. NPDC002701]|uniref:hypothetical protein n=1 Tax=Streptomyces sp. NPDC002701 TaxID=3364661 RepID=UPI003683B720
MTPFDRLLARARLVDEPYSPKDIDAAAARIAARAARRTLRQKAGAGREQSGSKPERGDCAMEGAAQDLSTLCETAVADTGAIGLLEHFIGLLPEPRGARVLGCILELTGQTDPARSWWQYAAGAGDRIAAYCLHLQHLTHGERAEARWWHQQTDAAPESAPGRSQDDVATTLRILRLLQAQRTGQEMPGLLTRLSQAGAVFDYIPAALSYTGDTIDLPLPDPDFTHHITTLTTNAPAITTGKSTGPATPPLPARTRPPRRTQPPLTPATPAPPSPSRLWHDSGGSFGYLQRIGDITTVWRRELAWQMFLDHCDTCRDCDPAGTPCPTYNNTTPSTMTDAITTGSPPPAGMKRRPLHPATTHQSH